MSETRYEGPIKAGMKYQYMDTILVLEEHDAKREAFVGMFRDGRRKLARPTTPEGWALFLPNGPLPDTGPKDLRAGQVWVVSNEYARLVFRIASLQSSSDGRESTTRRDDRIVLAGTDVTDNGDAMNASGMMRDAVLLFDAGEVTASGSTTGTAAKYLEKKGCITRRPGSSRTLRVVGHSSWDALPARERANALAYLRRAIRQSGETLSSRALDAALAKLGAA